MGPWTDKGNKQRIWYPSAAITAGPSGLHVPSWYCDFHFQNARRMFAECFQGSGEHQEHTFSYASPGIQCFVCRRGWGASEVFAMTPQTHSCSKRPSRRSVLCTPSFCAFWFYKVLLVTLNSVPFRQTPSSTFQQPNRGLPSGMKSGLTFLDHINRFVFKFEMDTDLARL